MQIQKLKTVDADTLLSTPIRKTQFVVDGIALPQADHFGSRWDRIAEKG